MKRTSGRDGVRNWDWFRSVTKRCPFTGDVFLSLLVLTFSDPLPRASDIPNSYKTFEWSRLTDFERPIVVRRSDPLKVRPETLGRPGDTGLVGVSDLVKPNVSLLVFHLV